MTLAVNLANLANFVDSSGQLSASAGLTGTVAVANGGTNATTAAEAQVNLGIQTSATGSNILATGTEAQRDATPQQGYIRFNTDSDSFEGYNGIIWGSIGGGATGGGGDSIFYLNGQLVTANYTIAAGNNAGTFGPVGIASGVTVTIADGSVWSIV